MKAWLLDRLGDGVEKLRLADVPEPRAAGGEVVLRIAFAGLNPADRYLAENQYPGKPSLPHILGRDGIGIVETIGAGVSGFNAGEKKVVVRSEIGVNRPGTFAELVAVPVESLVDVPAGWSDEEAGGATLVYLTAYQALSQWGELPPSVVLVTGASGGVGVATIQLAKTMGHTAVGLSRSPEKGRRLRELGADAVFDPMDPDWRKAMTGALGGRRVDLAVDNIGGPLFSQVVDSLGFNGRISCVGRLAGPVPQFNTASLFFRRAKIGGVAVGTYTPAESRGALGAILGYLSQSGARPLVDSVHEFGKLAEAFGRLKEGPMGKVLLRVAPVR